MALTDAYKQITDFVLEQLEKGEVIWRKGWSELGPPKNISSGNVYKGWNSLLLNFITLRQEFKTPYFITYKQAMDLSGRIIKGEKGFTVLYWATVEKKAEPKESGLEEKPTSYRIPKCHWVFNIDQTCGITFPEVEHKHRSFTQKIEACENIVRNMPIPPALNHCGDQPHYNKITDSICIPPPERFHSDENYYHTLFHELAHSTGHELRLNRSTLVAGDGFGMPNYGKEELVAELSASFLCGHCGIRNHTLPGTGAYISGWLKALRNDKRLLLQAATGAQAATDFILKGKPVEMEENAGQKEALPEG